MVYDGIVKSKKRLAREVGTIIKDWGGRLPVALVYPNSYYIGMSNLGLQAVYSLLNGYDSIVAERVFWEEETPLSVESQRPLSDFATLAFSVNYELDYFNVVRVLQESGIPLYATDRDERHPLVIAGGPCIMANPTPLALFFDSLCIGEAEAILPAMLPVVTEGISGRRDKLLRALAGLPGVYVPSLGLPTRVVRQYAANLDDFPVASAVLTPDTELGNLFLIEVGRGCPWGCRFCLVSQAFSPGRFRSMESILGQAEQGLKYRKRIGLVGPVVSDHPGLEDLLAELRRLGAGLSISSMRVKPLAPVVLRELAAGGVRTITLAPEAGSERLRRLTKKGVTEDDILEAVGMVAAQSFKQFKLYFMIGLPQETEEDIQAIVDLVLRSKAILERRRSGCQLSLNVSPFVPKAGTPFQWLPMAPLEYLNQGLSLLKKGLLPEGVNVKSESPAWSQVQAVLARGDTGLAGVLAAIEVVTLTNFRRAMAEHGLDLDHYAHRRWDVHTELPWAFIDSGVEFGYLERELQKAFSKV